MLVVGLTGGIGAGKSTVSSMLEQRGAVVLDADEINRELQQPGSDAVQAIAQELGPHLASDEGALDRAALAKIVFSEPAERKRLEDIMWPRIRSRIESRISELRDTDTVIVVDMAILLEFEQRLGRLTDRVVVVAASPDSQVEHLQSRGMSADDARARMTAQAPLEVKLQAADHVVWNEGTFEELQRRVDVLWDELRSHRQTRQEST